MAEEEIGPGSRREARVRWAQFRPGSLVREEPRLTPSLPGRDRCLGTAI